MSEYNYISDAEREWTQRYEGAYTPEEIELNKKLQDECSKDILDFAAIEELLKQGADPLGGIEICGWGLLEHIYGDTVVCESQDSDSVNLPRLTELFLRFGMDVGNPRIPYDGNFSLNPLWYFAHTANENATFALKMLLDHGLSADDFAEFWDHAMIDLFYLHCGDPENDAFWDCTCTWIFKMLLLGASYDHIFNNNEHLREFICCDFNSYDIHNFQNWNDYEYYFDARHCNKGPVLYGSLIHIYKKENGQEVWKIGVGVDGRKLMAIL